MLQVDDIRTISSRSGTREVRWLTPAHIGSPAFWIDQTARSSLPRSPRIGQDLVEEVGACILGGFGITGPMTISAFAALQSHGLLVPGATAEEIESVLREPLAMPDGHSRRYRFARQRALRLADAFRMLGEESPRPGMTGRELREWLLRLPGVGLKTASWIARNVSGDQDIAVIDIHILRAGQVAGVFDMEWTAEREYRRLEDYFCAWAEIGGVPTTDLDICIWSQLAHAAQIGVWLDRRSTEHGTLSE